MRRNTNHNKKNVLFLEAKVEESVVLRRYKCVLFRH